MIKITKNIAESVVQKRDKHSYKGKYGRVLIIGGNENMGGAVIMNAQAAVYSGAGLVTVATHPDNKAPLHARLPEVMVTDYKKELENQVRSADVVLIGSGIGEELAVLKATFAALEGVLQQGERKQTLIVDGSALTMLAGAGLTLPEGVATVLTPHQMEWQRLSGVKIADQKDQEKNQKALESLSSSAILVLKSEATQVYWNHDCFELTVGGPYQATGGMGDTLAGMVAGFTAQFTPCGSAVLAAVYSHSAIAEELSQRAYVTLPSEIAKGIPAFMKKLADQES
ncbi:NAD(P)H-hydrate dehydratase [Fructobacillus sp. M2-14]|uniref:ADP-dependent (S)-NAD(P)H-hydrate dehydratase n=1 Tax=Fructobacillus broussonetiae TaxID=2713173 RepID=A0ABS5QYX0_9LACO|nr:NAD(P)H-hydrate dehydratase [Fructobacillus broussonetiae]MBS9338403.1 NAD(P)H-hydrate dehydratase [Fructobacillus broussonetiae]